MFLYVVAYSAYTIWTEGISMSLNVSEPRVQLVWTDRACLDAVCFVVKYKRSNSTSVRVDRCQSGQRFLSFGCVRYKDHEFTVVGRLLTFYRR